MPESRILRRHSLRWISLVLGSGGLLGCGSAADESAVYEPWIGSPGARPQPFLAFPPDAQAAPSSTPNAGSGAGFPVLLSQTGAFADVAELAPAPGLVPYDIQAPLWSDGAKKSRWAAVPDAGEIGFSESGAWRFPEGAVFVKHFEMALDEREPQRTRRLETRVWIAARQGEYYGATYRWNEEESDAELLLSSETEQLSITGADGQVREQPYYYPGPRECFACHNATAGYVLGARTAQLNRERVYREGTPAVNQLVAWSGWNLLDEGIDNTDALFYPRLVELADEEATPEQRVRSYWDGNCSMCHAGSVGSVPGWDARFTTRFEEQGLELPPRRSGAEATHLIAPGAPAQSFIYQRGDTVDTALRMPPLGRNRVDAEYLELLERWIIALE
jgi:uncharacterized repeat protein (TIGR03806 family)